MRARKRGYGRNRGGRGPPVKCVCPNPNCDHKEKHLPGERCLSKTCPKCGYRLIGQW